MSAPDESSAEQGRKGPQPAAQQHEPFYCISLLFYHLVGGREQGRRDAETERLGGFAIDHKLEFGRLLNREITWICPFQDAINVLRRAPKNIDRVNSIGHQTTGGR